MHNEFFPPTKEELEKIIKELEAQLEDDAYQEDWIKIHDELMYRENQMKEILRNEKIT